MDDETDRSPDLLDVSSLQRVAVFRALHLGDMLCAVPALRALRAALPAARIVLVGLPWAREWTKRYPHYIDDFLVFPGYPGLPEQSWQASAVTAFLRRAQAQRFDLAIQMHGDGRLTNPLLMLLGARTSAGFFQPGDYCPDAARFLVYPQDEPEPRRLLHLLTFLGAPSRGEAFEFPLTPTDEQAARALREAAGLSTADDYVCLHPGARASARRWGAEHFAAVGDALAATGLRVLLTGSEAEGTLTAAVVEAMRAPAVDLAGQTDLGALGALLRDARLLVCNDTGVSHLASALDVPSVVVFSGSDPGRWAPLDRQRHRVVAAFKAGEKLTSVQAVLNAAQELLRAGRAHAA
jgi:ADP-heptose:LPS heptosyltransferase